MTFDPRLKEAPEWYGMFSWTVPVQQFIIIVIINLSRVDYDTDSNYGKTG